MGRCSICGLFNSYIRSWSLFGWLFVLQQYSTGGMRGPAFLGWRDSPALPARCSEAATGGTEWSASLPGETWPSERPAFGPRRSLHFVISLPSLCHPWESTTVWSSTKPAVWTGQAACWRPSVPAPLLLRTELWAWQAQRPGGLCCVRPGCPGEFPV